LLICKLVIFKNMIPSRFETLRKFILDECEKVYKEKGKEYATSADVLQNFKDLATRLNVSPKIVWAIFFYKHVTSLLNWASSTDDTKMSEPLQGRIVDVINYALFAQAIESDLALSSVANEAVSDALQHMYEEQLIKFSAPTSTSDVSAKPV
jgi:hypothetical protein